MPDALYPKYPADLFLEFRSVDRFLYRVSDLSDLGQYVPTELLERLDKCHIYILGKRSRLSAAPQTLRVTSEGVSFDVMYRIRGKDRGGRVEIARKDLLPEERAFQISPYPHRELVSLDANGTIVGYTLLANFAHVMSGLDQEAKDLEVIYVGKGLRHSAQDRLENHSTLQRILADVNSNDPDAEVFALVYAFKYLKNCFAFRGVRTKISGQEAKQQITKAASYEMPLEEQVALIEASCISYFRPAKYNTHYLDFPSQQHAILRPVRENDYAAIVVQLDQTNIGSLRIYSEKVQPDSTHYIVTDFRGPDGYVSMFDARLRP